MTLQKRSINLSGHGTSLALEPEFWVVLGEMSVGAATSLSGLIATIDEGRGDRPLASSCRIAVLAYLQGRRATDDDGVLRRGV